MINYERNQRKITDVYLHPRKGPEGKDGTTILAKTIMDSDKCRLQTIMVLFHKVTKNVLVILAAKNASVSVCEKLVSCFTNIWSCKA